MFHLRPWRSTAETDDHPFNPLIRKIGLGLLVLTAALLILFWDASLSLFHELAFTAIEFLEQELEALFSKMGLDHYHAQMVTAWTGFFIFLGISILLIRKIIQVTKTAKAKIPVLREQTADAAKSWWQRKVHQTEDWWTSLSFVRKFALVVAGVIFIIPFFWGLALVLAGLFVLLI